MVPWQLPLAARMAGAAEFVSSRIETKQGVGYGYHGLQSETQAGTKRLGFYDD